MPSLNLSLEEIVERIVLTLPSKFIVGTDSTLYKFLKGIGQLFLIPSNQIDDLFDRTSLTATGQYLDDYISDLINIGRKENETDEDYVDRYYSYIFKYNCTKDGMKEIVYDVVGYYPSALVDKQRGMFWNAKFYWNDSESIWAKTIGTPFVGYIILNQTPTDEQINELCKLIDENKAAGVQIFLKIPSS